MIKLSFVIVALSLSGCTLIDEELAPIESAPVDYSQENCDLYDTCETVGANAQAIVDSIPQ